MASKAFSLASWNVEHFQDDQTRINRVVEFVKLQKPDVFGLYEVEGKSVFAALTGLMPTYQFHITEGPQTQEILVGVKGGITAFFTQKIEFKSGNQALRPGALLTVTRNGADYSILFLHTKSTNDPVGLGIRDDQFQRAFDFKKVLDKAAKSAGQAGCRYMFLGDLNTMGMKYPFNKSINAGVELDYLDQRAKKVGMRRLEKTALFTWWNGPQGSLPRSNLDHIVATQNLAFRKFGAAEVDVRGWPKEATDAAQGAWIAKYSDHALLYVDVMAD
jgi:exonuclease III